MKPNNLQKQCIVAVILVPILAAFGLSGCGSGAGTISTVPISTNSPTPNSSATPGPTPTPTPTPVPTPSVNPFANTFSGLVALRSADNQLTGDFANVTLQIDTNGNVTGTLTVQPDSDQDAGASKAYHAGGYSYHANTKAFPVSRANPIGTVALSGSSDPQTGVFTVTGSAVDTSGVTTDITLMGTPQQLSSNQLTLVALSVKTNNVTTTGKGSLKGKNQVPLPAGVNPVPLLTGTLKIPRGVTVRFAPTGSSVPANPDTAETGDVVNFSLGNYNSPGFDGYSNIDSGGWAFAFDGTYFTITVPKDAPITTGYTVRDRSTGTGYSADFEVVDSPLQQYPTANTNFIGSPILADVEFFPALDKINQAAVAAGVKVNVTNSFRVAGQTLQGTVVPPAGMSNHLVGHAIDMNVQYTDSQNKTQACNSVCLGQSAPPAAVTAFINAVKAAGLRYGGDFTPSDVVHFDDGYNANANQWLQKYGIIQQVANN